MVFPHNVYCSVSGNGGMSESDKNKFYGQMIAFFGVILFLGGCWVCYKYLRISVWFAFLGGLAIILCIGVSFFRFVVFDEQAKIYEYKSQSSDNFAKYVQIRKDATFTLDVNGYKVSIFEFINGNNFCVIQLRYGSNDKVKSRNTQYLMEQYFHTIAAHNLEFRTIEATENFANSVEIDRYSKRLNKIQDKTLAIYLMKVLRLINTTVESMNNTSTLYLVIQTQRNYQLPQLESCIRSMIADTQSSRNALRTVEFLNWAKLMEFYREFYSLEAIDLSTMRVMALAGEEDTPAFANVVGLYQFTTEDNRTLTTNKGYQPNTGVKVID